MLHAVPIPIGIETCRPFKVEYGVPAGGAEYNSMPSNQSPAEKRYPKPIIGLVGGIGAGKSTVAGELEKLGCAVIDSDKLAAAALQEPVIQAQLRQWWGEEICPANGSINRQALAAKVFANPGGYRELERLNGLIHPRVAQMRREKMLQVEHNPLVVGVVWDSPLLVESGLQNECDAIIFVKASEEMRRKRVFQTRGWDDREIRRREKFQAPLDKKMEIADYIVDNDGDWASSGTQTCRVLSQILAEFGRIPPSEE